MPEEAEEGIAEMMEELSEKSNLCSRFRHEIYILLLRITVVDFYGKRHKSVVEITVVEIYTVALYGKLSKPGEI